ncbi:MAG: LysM peptidoglycan-binding domain-containing protein [Clostridia bacterium]|nr:LysM peptidoglycan-binding domain-containing protein [Clostridia bacterium]
MKKIFYRVKKGDTLISISRELDVPVFSIIKNNYLSAEVQDGDMLVIVKPKKCYKVEPLDTFNSISIKFDVEVEKLKSLNSLPFLFYGVNIVLEE